MAPRIEPEHEHSSDSSFLDVITNCVGILIILVIVVGIRAKKFPYGLTAPAPDLSSAKAEVAAVEQDVHKISAQMEIVGAELAARSFERDQVGTLITAAERELADRRAALDERSKQQYDLQRDLALARDEMTRLNSERMQMEKMPTPQVIKVESYPTPIGKTVDEKEVHFQLSGGRLTHVPFESLVTKLKGVVREQAYKLESVDEVNDTLGPIDGFRMRYYLQRFDTPQGSYVAVSHIDLLPVSETLGETVDAALERGSQFRDRLTMLSPRQYTITIWTYPDSFAEYCRLKKDLYGLGYAVAARPLPQGMPIGASPNGSKSSAE